MFTFLKTPLTIGACIAVAQVAVAAGTILGSLQMRELRSIARPTPAPIAAPASPSGTAHPPGWEGILAPVGKGWG